MGLCGVHYSWRSDHLSEKKQSKTTASYCRVRGQNGIVEGGQF